MEIDLDKNRWQGYGVICIQSLSKTIVLLYFCDLIDTGSF